MEFKQESLNGTERDVQTEPGEPRRIIFFTRVGRYIIDGMREGRNFIDVLSLRKIYFDALYILDIICIVQLYRTTDCHWSRELVNYSGRCLLFIYSYIERERGGTRLQNSSSRSAKFEQVRKRRIRNYDLSKQWSNYCLFIVRRLPLPDSPIYILLFSSGAAELRETRKVATPRSIFAQTYFPPHPKRRGRRSVVAIVVPCETNGRDPTSLSGRRF